MPNISQDRSSVEWTTFNKFVEFTKAGGVDDKSVVSMARTELNGTDFDLAKSASDRIHKLCRSTALKEANDNVRNVFRQSVLDLFHVGDVGNLPPNVKTAMELEDYGCGKPLSARRIKAVSEAIERCDQDVNGKRIVMDENIANGDAIGFEDQINRRIATSDYGSDDIFNQISKDVFRATRHYLSTEEEDAFVNNPYGACKCEGVRRGYMLNGRQFPKLNSQKDTGPVKTFAAGFLADNAPADRRISPSSTLKTVIQLRHAKPNDFVPLQGPNGLNTILHSLAERKLALDRSAQRMLESYALTHNAGQVAEYKDAIIRSFEGEIGNGDLGKDLAGVIVGKDDSAVVVTHKDLKLRNAAVYFCQQAGLSLLYGFSVLGEQAVGGRPVYDQDDSEVDTVNAIPLPDGKGYDISVSQTNKSVSLFKKSETQCLRFNPLHPGEVSVKCVYHVEMDGDRVKVSLKSRPEMRLRLPKPISEDEYWLRSRELVLRNLDDIVVRTGKKDFWDALANPQRTECIDAALNCLKLSGSPVTINKAIGAFQQVIAEKVRAGARERQGFPASAT